MKKTVVWFWLLLIPFLLRSHQEKNVLRIGIHHFPLSLNPVFVTDETSQAIANKIFDSLFYFNEGGEITAGLVYGYFLDEDQNVISIELKKGQYFSDGREMDVDDVLATFNLLKDEKMNYPYQSMLSPIQKMEKINRYNFKMKMKVKQAIWKSLLTFKILNSKEIGSLDPAGFKSMILSGTGPYKLDSIKEPVKVVLSRNQYHPAKFLYPKIEYIVVSATHLAPLKLVNGEIDVCELQPEDAIAYRSIKGWKRKFELLKYKKFGFTYLIFNLSLNALTENIRRIFYNQLVNGNFVQRFLKGKGEPVRTPFLLLNPEEKPVKIMTRRLENPLKLRILTNSESRLRKDFVLFLNQALRSDNILLEPIFLEYQTFIGQLKKGFFDIAISGFVLDIDYDMKDVFSRNSYFNYGNFCHSEMDRLMEAGLIELDPVKRLKIYQKANQIWKEELPLIPLFNLYYHVGISKGIKIPDRFCSIMGSSGDFLINIQDWTLR